MAQHVIGLDVGSWSIKAAVLESGLRKFSLEAFSEYVLPADDQGLVTEHLGDSVRHALEPVNERSQVIITAAPGSRVMTREMELPFDDAKRIRSVLPFELDSQLPTPVDRLVVDYAPIGKTEEGGTRIMASAVAQHWLREFLADLKLGGADPKTVGLDTMAYAGLIPRLAESGSLGVEDDLEEFDVAFIDLGHQSSSICIVHNGSPVTVRSLARGGRSVTQALSDALDVSYSEAEQIKHTGVRLDGHTPVGVDDATHQRRVAVVGEALGSLVRDLRMTLHAHFSRTGRRVAVAFVFGGTARMPGLIQRVGEALGVKAKAPRITRMGWSKIDSDGAVDMSVPKAAALALRNAVDGSDAAQVDFRKGEFSFESDFKAFRDRAWWLATLAILLVGVLIGRQYLAKERLVEQKTALVSELKSFSKQTLGKESTSFDTVLKKMGTAEQDPIDELFPKMTAFKAFYLVTEAQDQTNALDIADAGIKAPGPAVPRPPFSPGVRGTVSKDKTKSKAGDDKDGGGKAGDGEDGADGEAKEKDKPRYRVEFKSVNIDHEKATIRGEVNDIDALAEFEGRLSKLKCFRELKRTDTKNSRNRERATWKEFTVQIKLQCEVPKEAVRKKKSSGGSKSGSSSKGGK